ncbi:PA2778 family cysteine peptidase [Vibrio profundum]|uniref:PA2778 family cysteine peptidase n=1 Tax=Vibrio profundum TaxID=2910247 RepID=UPI003D124D35
MIAARFDYIRGTFYVLILTLTAGCSHQTPHYNTLHGDTPLPNKVELISTPFFPQDRYQCGPAALATILTQSDVITSPNDLKPYVYLPKRQGTLAIDLIATTRRYQRVPYLLEGKLSAIFTEIANGTSVLVMQNLGFSWFPQWHFAVVVGYDLDAKTVMLRSGEIKRHVIPISTFQATWSRARYWAMVAAKPNQIPITANPFSYTKAVHDLSKTHPDVALLAYRTALIKWPQEPLLWLALANTLYQKNELKQSEQALVSGLTHIKDLAQLSTRDIPQVSGRPQTATYAQLWNNYAFVLKAQGCTLESIKAIQCAALIAPHNQDIQSSVLELTTPTSKQALSKHCQLQPCPVNREQGMSSSGG